MNVVDSIPLGGIVSIRDRLLAVQAAGRRVLRLESGDPSFDIPPHVREAIERALRDGHTHYTAGQGIPALRKAAAEKMSSANGIPVAGPEQVLITNGSMHALYVVFRALCEPGDEVIVPDPTWTETADNVTLAGGVAVRCPLDPARGWAYEAGRIEELVTPRTRAIVVNSPHNPTGAVLDRAALEAILAVAERHGLVVVSDEAYEHVIFDGREHVSVGSLPGAGDRVVSLFSMSKSYAMSGLRIGYLTTTDERLLERATKLLRCTINGVNSATQHGAVAALTGPQDATASMRATYQARRDTLVAGLERCPFLAPFRPEGAFYVWCTVDPGWRDAAGRSDGWALTGHLVDSAGIGSAPGEVFGPRGAGCLRFAFSCPTDQVEEAARLLAAMER